MIQMEYILLMSIVMDTRLIDYKKNLSANFLINIQFNLNDFWAIRYEIKTQSNHYDNCVFFYKSCVKYKA